MYLKGYLEMRLDPSVCVQVSVLIYLLFLFSLGIVVLNQWSYGIGRGSIAYFCKEKFLNFFFIYLFIYLFLFVKERK